MQNDWTIKLYINVELPEIRGITIKRKNGHRAYKYTPRRAKWLNDWVMGWMEDLPHTTKSSTMYTDVYFTSYETRWTHTDTRLLTIVAHIKEGLYVEALRRIRVSYGCSLHEARQYYNNICRKFGLFDHIRQV